MSARGPYTGGGWRDTKLGPSARKKGLEAEAGLIGHNDLTNRNEHDQFPLGPKVVFHIAPCSQKEGLLDGGR